jgi:hypothetical protein
LHTQMSPLDALFRLLYRRATTFFASSLGTRKAEAFHIFHVVSGLFKANELYFLLVLEANNIFCRSRQ